MTPEDEKRYVTREEFDRKYDWLKRGIILALWVGLTALILCTILAIASHADSTFVPIEKPKRQICHIDTIYTDDPRCGQLDSTYVLPHDTTIIGLIVRIDGHWEWYNWVNGKRVNMRSVK